MPIIESKNSIRKKINFMCSPSVDMVCSLHVLSDPKHHINCIEWSQKAYEAISPELKEDIDFFSKRYNQFAFIMDIVSETETVNINTVNETLSKIEQMSRFDFSYLFLGATLIEKDELEKWLIDPNLVKKHKDIELFKYISRDNIIYFLKNQDYIRFKIIDVLHKYWNDFFCCEWYKIHGFYMRKIKLEKMHLYRKPAIDYLTDIHEDLYFDNDTFIFKKTTEFKIEIYKIDEVFIFPSVFPMPHLMINIVGNRLTLYLNLVYDFNTSAKDEVPKLLVNSLKALGDTTRLKIIKVLFNGDKTTKELSEILEFAPSTISEHLRILKEAELVKSTRVKNKVYYSLPDVTLEDVFNNFKTYLGC